MKTSERDTWVFGEAKRRVLLMDSGMCKKWHVLHMIKFFFFFFFFFFFIKKKKYNAVQGVFHLTC